ncbi:MAG: site-2 protease family protein [Candidatus Micrarchaeota archaeon]|nr:site-2 protease family protein [Candidatus Micrarchaeota archaeon]
MRSNELLHILVSVLTISLAFTMVFTNTTELAGFGGTFVMVFFTVGLGFIVHELSHRFIALRYGAHATYRAWTIGLIFAVVTAAVFGFVFAAPGAVYIYGKRLTRDQDGKIALAGPAANFILALAFIAGSALLPGAKGVFGLGAQVNLFLGLFNLLPVFPMDGSKVISWSTKAWAAAFIAFIALMTVPLA